MEKAKILPHNIEAEQSVLGCAFLSAEAALSIFENLKPRDFYTLAHQKIFAILQVLYRDNKPIDYITATRALEADGSLEDVGGPNYIVSLTNAVPSAANYKHYVDIIENDSTLRRLIDASQDIITKSFETQSAPDVLALAEKSIMDISTQRHKSELTHISSGVTEVISRMEKMSVDKNAFRGLRTGFRTLDNYTNGLQKSDLILLAARPSIGKSSLAMNICENAALYNNASVAVFSLEMPLRQLAARAISSIGFVPLSDINKGSNAPNTWDLVLESGDKLKKAKIYIDDTSLIRPTEILSKCRKLKREHGLDLIMIDYLQLMTSDSTRSSDNRQTEISSITRLLKVAARELDVPILLLSQLSRAVETRTDKTPMLSDLRESGAIEQDADIVMFIHRPDRPAEDVTNDADTDCDLIISKHRNGPTGRIKLKWAAEFVRFYEPEDAITYINRPTPPAKVEMTKIENNETGDLF